MLKDLVKNKRVALVGPSPHILGKKQGSYIDSFDIVIRVNEFGIPSSLYEDYGSRTDIIMKGGSIPAGLVAQTRGP